MKETCWVIRDEDNEAPVPMFVCTSAKAAVEIAKQRAKVRRTNVFVMKCVDTHFIRMPSVEPVVEEVDEVL